MGYIILNVCHILNENEIIFILRSKMIGIFVESNDISNINVINKIMIVSDIGAKLVDGPKIMNHVEYKDKLMSSGFIENNRLKLQDILMISD